MHVCWRVARGTCSLIHLPCPCALKDFPFKVFTAGLQGEIPVFNKRKVQLVITFLFFKKSAGTFAGYVQREPASRQRTQAQFLNFYQQLVRH